MSRSTSPQHVLITGGASGLGRALAEAYLANGAKVLITDINTERGEATQKELAGRGDITFLEASTTAAADWDKTEQWVQSHWGRLDVLVNNAGVAAGGRIDKITMEDWDWIIDINLKGVVRGCRQFTPMFKTQGSGQIINIASLAALANAPTMSSYNVTKAGVLSLSETLRHELAPYGIQVSVVCPNFFQTNLADNLRTPEAGFDSTVRKLLAGGKLSATDIATRIVKAAAKDEFMILPHVEGKALNLIKRYTPFLYNQGVGNAGRRLKKRFER